MLFWERVLPLASPSAVVLTLSPGEVTCACFWEPGSWDAQGLPGPQPAPLCLSCWGVSLPPSGGEGTVTLLTGHAPALAGSGAGLMAG